MDPLKMYFLLKMGIFHCYVSLPEGTSSHGWFSIVMLVFYSFLWCTFWQNSSHNNPRNSSYSIWHLQMSHSRYVGSRSVLMKTVSNRDMIFHPHIHRLQLAYHRVIPPKIHNFTPPKTTLKRNIIFQTSIFWFKSR